MSILYINRGSVCFCNDDASKVYYFSDKSSIDYSEIDKYIDTIGKNGRLIVIIGSFYTNVEFVQKKNSEINFLDFLQLKLNNQNVICGNISVLNKNKTEAVVTTISSDEQECHIVKIIEILRRYNIDLRYIYCLEQLPLLYGLTSDTDPYSKNYIPELDIIVILLEDKFFLSVANGKDFILGREIIIQPNSDTVESITHTLSMVIKNLEITYTNINSKFKIKVFGFTESVDVDGWKNKDIILRNTDISYTQLQIGSINVDALPSVLMYEVLMITFVLPKLKYLQPLTSRTIKKHIMMFNVIRYIKLVFFFSSIAVSCLLAYCIISIFVLAGKRQVAIGNLAKGKQILQKYQDNNDRMVKDIVDVAVMKMQQLKLEDAYDEPLKMIARITNDKKSFLDVQGYKFDCFRSTRQDKIFFISFDIEIFNEEQSYAYIQTTIGQLIADISEELRKKYKKVSVFDKKVPKLGIKELAVEDFFDTIYVVCTNYEDYNLPFNDGQFQDFLLNEKKQS